MAEDSKAQSWWQTLPGILTATAGIITAIAGLIAVLYQVGFVQHNKQESVAVAAVSSSAKPAVRADEPRVDAPLPAQVPQGSTPVSSKSINLLAAENGGQLIVASSDEWAGTIDGKEGYNQISYGLKAQAEAVYAFKDERPATIEMFTMLVPGTEDTNVKEFELFIGNDAPTGAFESIGRFKTQNAKLFKTPYQEFKFPPVKAKYLKIKLLSTYGATHPNVPEVQLFGRMAN